MTDPEAGGFKALSGAEALDRLVRQSPHQRRATMRRLTCKKGLRPARMQDQIILCDEPALTDFDRLHAMIAGSHKVCKDVMTDEAIYWLDPAVQDRAAASPHADRLRLAPRSHASGRLGTADAVHGFAR
jgi:hypothetical protein